MAMGAFDERQQFSDETFSRLTVGGENIAGKIFEKCAFEKCRFLECVFTGCKFVDCTFANSMLSAVKFVDCSFLETSFADSKVIGTDWTKAANLRALAFSKCDVTLSNFSFLKLPSFSLTDCMAKEASFLEADCANANMEGTDFESCTFLKTNLTGANFKRAFNYSIDFNYNVLKKAKFSMPEAASLLQGLDIVIEE
jgi:fluoroquinolone resistance protein